MHVPSQRECQTHPTPYLTYPAYPTHLTHLT